MTQTAAVAPGRERPTLAPTTASVQSPPPPASGAWRPGDPVGRRRWAHLGALATESGAVIPEPTVAYECWGTLAPDHGNAVLLLHALTGDSHAAGPAAPGHPTPGWWDALIGPGRAIDTTRWFLVVPNVLGGCQGTTGPSCAAGDGRPWGSRFPELTIRDQVAAEILLADALGIERWAAVLGGSMGGTRALEWAIGRPERVARLGLLCCAPAASADRIAWAGTQLAAITSDPGWRGGDYHDAGPGDGPHQGLALARRIAHLTYRCADELEQRFGRAPQPDPSHAPSPGRDFAVESYLDHQADRLVRRFDAGSYVALTRALNRHDVGRDRGGIAEALRRIRAESFVAAIPKDRLYPAAEQRQLARALPGGREVFTIDSARGHDGFLTETGPLAAFLARVLA